MNTYDYCEQKGISLRQMMDFTSGANPLGLSNAAKHAIRKQVKFLEYAPDEELRYLKRHICKKEGIGADEIVFTAGSTHLLQLLFQIVKPRKVVLLSPLSRRFEETASVCGVQISPFPLEEERGFTVDMEGLFRHVKGADMVIIASPHDRTGKAIPKDDLLNLIDETERLGKTLVIDEALRGYSEMESPVGHVTRSSSAIIIRTFSLFHGMAGLRIGYGIGPEKLIHAMNGARPSWQMNGLAPHAALMSLKDREFKSRTMKFIDDEKAYLRQKLSAINGVDPIERPGNMLLVKVTGELEVLKKQFLERNILIDGFPGKEGKVYITLPMGRHKANAFFVRALRRIMGKKI
ncbi:MAG: hypothetical protein C0392_09610 [Syntrophus sp. (in: bacteria)]|nr:hypothetical protein [Syntrophus sp. (in: bacteria)]